nr:uncharacterized protein LOC129452465 isoform X1 [Misgurnus anguillicaudatus]XP_055072306.1 uncharacterized protein LOC129452465 isoform X1 [Misgurnus anguillicaudatus]
MNQSVVLTCEVSDVTDLMMLAWLIMDGDRGVLVKQQILNKKNSKKRLTVNVNSIQSDMQHWQCAVFTENKLKALAPITINLISNDPGKSTETPTSTYQDDTWTQDSHVQTMILLACSVTVCVLILLGLLVFKCQRKTFAGDGTSMTEMRPYSNTSQTDPVGTAEGRDIVLKSREEEEELHYASVTAGCIQGADSLLGTNASSKVLDSSSPVIYSAIKIHSL